MPWAPPAWCCKPLAPDAPRAVVTLQSQSGKPRRHDLEDHGFYLLTRGDENSDSQGELGSSWHAAVLRNEQGHFFIMDLMSSTGTYMKEVKLEPNRAYRWKPGTTVVLGIPKKHDKATLEISDPLGIEAKAPQRGQKRAADLEPVEPAAKRRHGGVEPAPASSSKGSSSPSKCDKCDGPHATEACPHFKKARDNHKDAWAHYGKPPQHLGDKGGAGFVLRRGHEVRQPGDGSCLFHSLCFGLNGGRKGGQFGANQLRKELASFIARNPHLEMAGDTLEEWVRWDARASVAAYTRRMASGGWGGGIEMAACCLSKRVNVHVYERRRGVFERISCFACPQQTNKTIHVLYQGGVHYDALVPCQ